MQPEQRRHVVIRLVFHAEPNLQAIGQYGQLLDGSIAPWPIIPASIEAHDGGRRRCAVEGPRGSPALPMQGVWILVPVAPQLNVAAIETESALGDAIGVRHERK